MVFMLMVSLNILDVLSKQIKLLLCAHKLCTFKAENDSCYFHKKVDARTCDCCTAESVDSPDRDLSSITEPLRPAVMKFVKCKWALYFTLLVCHCFRIQYGHRIARKLSRTLPITSVISQKFSENVLCFPFTLRRKWRCWPFICTITLILNAFVSPQAMHLEQETKT